MKVNNISGKIQTVLSLLLLDRYEIKHIVKSFIFLKKSTVLAKSRSKRTSNLIKEQP